MKLDKYKPIRRFRKNRKGTDYAVGDIHGCFSKLQKRLEDIGFDPKVDRLFSVGDMIDRGKESHLSIQWLKKPWFNAVAGNHEQMLLDSCSGELEKLVFIMNGATWFVEYFHTEEAFEFCEAFGKLPLIMEIQTDGGVVAVLHSQIHGNDYSMVKKDLKTNSDALKNCIQWNREKVENSCFKPVENIKGVRAIVAGHTPLRQPLVLGNFYSIDTGAVFDRDFTLLRLDTLEFV